MGFNMILIVHRADTKYINGVVRMNCRFKIAIGGADSESYKMLFEKAGDNLQPQPVGKAWYMQEGQPQVIAIPLVKEIQI